MPNPSTSTKASSKKPNKKSTAVVSALTHKGVVPFESPYKYLVLEGGGVKGQCYLGVAKALDEAGILDNIVEISGASAGGIAALILSTGWPVEKIQERFSKLDFNTLIKGKGLFQKILEPFRMCRRVVKKYSIHSTKPFHAFFQAIIEEATTVIEPNGKVVEAGNPNMTFEEWHSFKERYPQLHLKDISVQACNLNTRLNETFSYYSEHKDVPIALAVSASMAFPFFFAYVMIKECQYSDGGEQNNCPYDVFQRKGGEYNPKVLCVRLDDIDEIYYLRYNLLPPKKKNSSFIQHANSHIKAVLNTQNRNFYHSGYSQNTIFCDTLNIDTLNFNLSQEEKDALQESAYYSTVRFLAKHNPEIAENSYESALLKRIRDANFPISFISFLKKASSSKPTLVRLVSVSREDIGRDDVDIGRDDVDGIAPSSVNKWLTFPYIQKKYNDFSDEDYEKHQYGSDDIDNFTSSCEIESLASEKGKKRLFFKHKRTSQDDKSKHKKSFHHNDEEKEMCMRFRKVTTATV